jgi:hypothetical protein
MSTIVTMETQITDANERLLVTAFDNALENIKGSELEAGKIARQLKEQYICKGKRIAGSGWQSFVLQRHLTVDTVDGWIRRHEQREGLRPLPSPKVPLQRVRYRQTTTTNYRPGRNRDYTSPPEAVRDYYECGRDEKGNTLYAPKGPGWDEPDLATVAQETDPDAQIDAAVEKIQEGATVEGVAAAVAELVIRYLSMLKSMDERRAAMRSAIGMIRQQGVLPQLRESTD